MGPGTSDPRASLLHKDSALIPALWEGARHQLKRSSDMTDSHLLLQAPRNSISKQDAYTAQGQSDLSSIHLGSLSLLNIRAVMQEAGRAQVV